MSNVHGFGQGRQGSARRIPPINRDPDHDDSNFNILPAGFQGDALEEQLKLAEEHKVLFVSGRRSLKNPREQHYWDMLVFGLCPNFQFVSLTFLIILADIALFIFQLSKGINQQSTNLLQIKYATAQDYGGNYYPGVRSGQVYRLLSAIFLHANFMHIFGNLLVTFMFLSRIEYSFGVGKTLAIYLLSGIAGNLFSVVIKQDTTVSVGASTALFGIIGVIIGYIIINWNGLDLLGPVLKCQIYCTGFMIIMFILIFTPSNFNSNIDYYGHLGGFLAGMWLVSIHSTIRDGQCEKVTRIVFVSLLVIQFLVCFLVLYLGKSAYA